MFDPFYGTQAAHQGAREFGFIIAFEVFEHELHPHRLVETLKRHLAQPGLLVFSTLLFDENIVADGKLSLWYVVLRNAHVSFFFMTLAVLARQHGLQFLSFNAAMHAF